jgi:hypothetical protein
LSPPTPAARAAYLSEVKQRAEQARKAREEALQRASKRLREEIRQWRASLPPEARQGRRTMAELVKRFRAPASAIGLALFELGWRRKRDWRGDRPYARWWRPPPETET